MDEPLPPALDLRKNETQARVQQRAKETHLTDGVRPSAQRGGAASLDVAPNATYCKLRRWTCTRPGGSSIGPGKPVSRNGPQAGSSIVPARLERQNNLARGFTVHNSASIVPARLERQNLIHLLKEREQPSIVPARLEHQRISLRLLC